MKAPNGFLPCLVLPDGEQVVGLYAQHTQSVRFYSMRETGEVTPDRRAESMRFLYCEGPDDRLKAEGVVAVEGPDPETVGLLMAFRMW